MWLLVVLCVYSTLAQFMMNYGNDWDMYLVPSYVGTQIWGTASHHVLLLSSRKSCLMTSRGKLVHWWGSWEGAGGPGRASRARRRRLPPVRRPPAPPAGGAGDGGGSAGSARGDGPRRRRGAARRGAERSRARCRRHRQPAARLRGRRASLLRAGRRGAGCAESAALCACLLLRARLFYTSSQILYDPLSGAGKAYVPSKRIYVYIFSPTLIPVLELSKGSRVLPMWNGRYLLKINIVQRFSN